MKKIVVLLMLALLFSMTLVGFTKFYKITLAEVEDNEVEQIILQLGDYIELGEHDFLWRYVSHDENGILMLSDHVISGMLFGEEKNNCWSDSYIRIWLNSTSSMTDSETWEWEYKNFEWYDEKGFLHSDHFTDSQKSVIKPVTQKTVLAPGFPNKILRGGSYDAWEEFDIDIIDPAQNGYNELAYELLTDKVFIPDIKQMWDIYQNRDILGNYYDNNLKVFYDRVCYWLRTPYGIPKTTRTSHFEDGLYDSTDRVMKLAWWRKELLFGLSPSGWAECVRPAFYLNEDTMIILSGDGSKENPYVVDGNGEPDVTVVVNEEILTFDQPPVIQNDRTLVPLRGIFEAMGAQVDWEEETKTITAQKDETVVTLQVDSDKMYVNGELVTLDVPAIVMNDRTLVPLRAISEAFGATVEWEQPFRLATIKN